MSTYDQWKTASPYDDDYDPTEAPYKALKDYRWARQNCATEPPSPWAYHLDEMARQIEGLIDWIANERWNE